VETTKNIFTFKAEQKVLAKKIRETKTDCKKLQKAKDYAGSLQYQILKLKNDYRHRHIAYSMLRGRTYEQVEKTCRKAPNFDRIKEIMAEYTPKEVEHADDVRACA
jgi:hypothetical protein